MVDGQATRKAFIVAEGDDTVRLELLLKQVLVDFRASFQAGEKPNVEALLAKHPELGSNANAALHLISQEYLLREEQGDTPRLDEYLSRFPQWADSLRIQFEAERGLLVAQFTKGPSESKAASHLTEDLRSSIDSVFIASKSARDEQARLPTVPGYELLGVLGRGGMGVVYQAKHLRLNRIVALKMLVGEGHADSEALARFKAEAEAVAALQHPNIVQIFEVGEHDVLPFLVLEYVGGGSLASSLKGVPQPPKLTAHVLETLARAIHYAHERNIVHRDLKPGNVLLAPRTAGSTDAADKTKLDGLTYEPKITDFGLARRVDGDSSQTRTGAILGTPSYMPPEQAEGRARDIGPAADIYSLGAILYECLTGRVPFLGDTLRETIMQVLRHDPVPPTQLQPSVPRDLETICLKCLEKEPQKRYASGQALAEDLHRFLAGEPIHARPSSLLERVGKWTRRHPAAAALAGVSLLATLVLLGAGIWFTLGLQAAHENTLKAQQRAETNFQRAFQAVEQMLTEVAEEQLGREPRMEKKRRAILEKALVFYQEFLKEKSDDPLVRKKTGMAYNRMGDILRWLGHHAQAQAAYREAIALLTPLAAAHPGEPEHRYALAESYNWLGESLRLTSQFVEARASYSKANEELEALAARFPGQPKYVRDQARSLYNLGIVLKDTDQAEAAAIVFQRAIALLEQLPPEILRQPRSQQDLARSYLNVAPVYWSCKQLAHAEDAYLQACNILQPLTLAHADEPEYRHELAIACNNRGNYLSDQLANLPAAESCYRHAAELLAKLVVDYPAVPAYRDTQANTDNSLGAVLTKSKDWNGARTAWEQARDRFDKLAKEFPLIPDYQGDLGMTLGNLGWLAQKQQNWMEARSHLEKGIGHIQSALKPNPRNPTYLQALRTQYQALAEASLQLQDYQQAASAAHAMPLVYGDRPLDYFLAARFLARCGFAAQADMKNEPPLRDNLRRQYDDQAIALLDTTLKLGFADAARLREEPAFEDLRRRKDFTALLDRLMK